MTPQGRARRILLLMIKHGLDVSYMIRDKKIDLGISHITDHGISVEDSDNNWINGWLIVAEFEPQIPVKWKNGWREIPAYIKEQFWSHGYYVPGEPVPDCYRYLFEPPDTEAVSKFFNPQRVIQL